MRNHPARVLAVAVALALAGLVLTMATDDRGLAFTLGVRPTQVAVVLKPGEKACQRPINVPADAASVEVVVGTLGRRGAEFEVTALSAARLLGSGRLPGGYPDNSRQRVKVAGIEEGNRISLCITNPGRTRLALYGGPPLAARTSALFLQDREQPSDLALIFHRERPRSTLSLLPAVFERAELFHATWIESWLIWMTAAAFVIAVPLMLMLALSSARAPAAED